MPRSMTGYGAASEAGSRIAVEVEVRTVNAKTRKVSLRTPAALTAHEPALESLVRDRVRRGSIQLSVRIDHVRPQDAVKVRTDVIEGLAAALEPLQKKGLLASGLTADAIASIPGAVELGSREPLRAADWKIVKRVASSALDELSDMRQREAVHLVRDLRRILKSMQGAVSKVKRRVPKIVEEARQKLEDRVNALLEDHHTTLDDATLAREIAVLADRSDVTEEITRLTAHIAEFDRYLKQDADIGRTLDFLSQEMLREINTIGSKSSDVETARAVVALKSDTERLKEQAANLE